MNNRGYVSEVSLEETEDLDKVLEIGEELKVVTSKTHCPRV
jgi:hypothetical protein